MDNILQCFYTERYLNDSSIDLLDELNDDDEEEDEDED